MKKNKKDIGVLVLGERNTGTNYLKKLLELNLVFPDKNSALSRLFIRLPLFIKRSERVTDLMSMLNTKVDGGWKHTQVDPKQLVKTGRNYGIRFVTLTKNPYSFCTSLFKNPYHQVEPRQQKIYDFIKSPWTTRKKDNTQKKVLDSPVELWNLKNAAYIEAEKLDPTIVLNLRWEDLITDPKKAVKKISEHFEINLGSDFFTDYAKSTKINPSTTNYKNYYKNEEWKNELDPATIKLINKKLDAKVVKHFKYKLIK